jgi:hypothetical protein
MKVTYPLKACPWCNMTPQFTMRILSGETWCPRIDCANIDCEVQPTTYRANIFKPRNISIRNKQRENISIIREKIERVIKMWNDGNLGFNNEGFTLDYEKMVKDYLSGKIGLPGYQQQEKGEE